jgi:aryl-alcohol dehydrogenase-like predicted oxidoreductase
LFAEWPRLLSLQKKPGLAENLNLMQYRKFGNTDLLLSEVGFGAWAIGGPAMVGDLPIGWGRSDDALSIRALKKSLDLGINFFDTADFYGLGHSEELIGKTLGNRPDVVVATKVGQKLTEDKRIAIDYTPAYVMEACEKSLRRLRREHIDLYQLHTAKVVHLRGGELVGALEKLQQQGKIRYWGVSLNTFQPEAEAEYCLENKLGHGFQAVINLLNQRFAPFLRVVEQEGLGFIARMPLQFGLLTGKFDAGAKFDESDHRSFRLTPQIIHATWSALGDLESVAQNYGLSFTELALSYVLSQPGVSTVIPGMRTPEQVADNVRGRTILERKDLDYIAELYDEKFYKIADMLQQQG